MITLEQEIQEIIKDSKDLVDAYEGTKWLIDEEKLTLKIAELILKKLTFNTNE